MIVTKTYNEILQNSLLKLSGTPITKTEPGSIARSLIEILAQTLADYYSILKQNIDTAFIQTAVGKDLERIGSGYGIFRLSGETDENLRWRISRAPLLAATGNMSSVYDAATKVSGVEDVLISVPFPGMLRVQVLGPNVVVDEMTLTAVETAISKVVAAGTGYEVVRPIYIDVSVKINVSLKKSDQADYIEAAARNVVTEYLNNLPIGGTIFATDMKNLISAIAPSQILRVDVTEISTSLGTIRGTIFEFEADERVVPNRTMDEPVKITIRS